MALSAFDLYTVGIGPSSSHTVGPMRAAKRFVDGLCDDDLLVTVARVKAELFGSLGSTGHGHGSDKAVVLGLEGDEPATVDTDRSDARVAAARDRGRLLLAGCHAVAFSAHDDLVLHRRKSLPAHPNGMTFTAYDERGEVVRARTYYSPGSGRSWPPVSTPAATARACCPEAWACPGAHRRSFVTSNPPDRPTRCVSWTG